jgi:hypothetical protein
MFNLKNTKSILKIIISSRLKSTLQVGPPFTGLEENKGGSAHRVRKKKHFHHNQVKHSIIY